MKVKSSFGPNYKIFEVGEIVFLAQKTPLKLSNGTEIKNFPLAYQTYGELNADKTNAILICHALTGDQYVASTHPVTGKKGWWDFMIGEGKAIDTNKFFVICSNIIGGCMGSFGPKSINPQSGEAYGLDFPLITIQDMVNAQNLLIENFGITKLHAVIGGSTGGMQALAWSVLYPQKIKLLIPLATSFRHSPQNIAFHEVGRQAIMADPNWCNGRYFAEKKYPTKGLAVARMTAHITYLSETSLQKKFGRNLRTCSKSSKESQSNHSPLEGESKGFSPSVGGRNSRERIEFKSYLDLLTPPRSLTASTLPQGEGDCTELKDSKQVLKQQNKNLNFDGRSEFEVESYLHHQGFSFVDRFDANSYLYITKATNYFDLESDFNGKLSEAFSSFAKNKDGKIYVISFSDDWTFPVSESKKLTQALAACGINVSSITIDSAAGHDSFLLENDTLTSSISSFLNQ